MSLDIPSRFITDLREKEAEANVAARNRLRDGKLQNGADLAEARKTANMIAQDCNRVLKAYRAVRHGNLLLAMRELGLNPRKGPQGTPADLWLELQYGWKPLISSIHDNAKALAKPRPKNSMEVKSSAKRRVTFTSERTSSEGFVEKWECIGDTRVAYKGRIENAGLVVADSYGLLNPAEIAWELIPFSFVIDWFIPIGNILSSLSASAGLSFAEGYRSTRYTAMFTSSRNGGIMEVAHFDFERVPFTQFELPDLYGKSNPFSTPHILNALALIFQNL
nr:MAG: maturation protein [Guiyang fiers-like virus 4]